MDFTKEQLSEVLCKHAERENNCHYSISHTHTFTKSYTFE